MTQLAQHRPDSCVALRPLEEGHAQLSIEEENGEEHITDLATLGHREAILDPNHASLTVDNSNDVIVGPVTQFYAPVTIYQHVNGQINAEGQNTAPEAVLDCAKVGDCKEKEKGSFHTKVTVPKYISISLLVVAILAALCVTIILTTHQSTNNPEDTEYEDPERKDPDLDKKWLLGKSDWNGKPSKNNTRVLKPPVNYVIIAHTVTPMCDTIAKCSERLRSIQAQHMSSNSPDIGYNFLIGADGHAYEGRGWGIVNFMQDDTISVSFIGDFTEQEPTEDMLQSGKDLLRLGVSLNVLSKDYVLLAHNQTWATLSPGQNLYKYIKEWQHFDPKKMF